MTKAGDRLIAAAREALDIAQGRSGFMVVAPWAYRALRKAQSPAFAVLDDIAERAASAMFAHSRQVTRQ